MIIKKSCCVGDCDPCIGASCANHGNYEYLLFCDRCGEEGGERERLYACDGQLLCADCMLKGYIEINWDNVDEYMEVMRCGSSSERRCSYA